MPLQSGVAANLGRIWLKALKHYPLYSKIKVLIIIK